MVTQSPIEQLASDLSLADVGKRIQSMTPEQAEALLTDWQSWARPNQLPPDWKWTIWLLMAGRGFGKTRVGAEWIRDRWKQGFRRMALVGKTPADVRDVMIEGDSGILAISPERERPHYEPSKRRLTWPNGAVAHAFSSYEPDQLRGPQFDSSWCDELGTWAYPQETWDNLMFGLRLGNDPRAVVTTTPKPIKLLTNLVKREGKDIHITRGNTYENRSNLPDAFFAAIIARYEGTRTGQQEIYAALLEEAEGALWTRGLIERNRVQKAPEMQRVIVAIDPAATNTMQSDETGIGAAGLGVDGNYYVLEDVSGRYTPDGWATAAWKLYTRLEADRIVGEVNNGGDMIEYTLRTINNNISYKAVHASRSKQARAEPIAALYEQNKVHHVGMFTDMEDQMCTWEPLSGDKSPDRIDWLVWALTELSSGGKVRVTVVDY